MHRQGQAGNCELLIHTGNFSSAPAPPASTSPAERGELSRRSPSEFEVQKIFPLINGLAGNSRMRVLPNAVSAAFLSFAELRFVGSLLVAVWRNHSEISTCHRLLTKMNMRLSNSALEA